VIENTKELFRQSQEKHSNLKVFDGIRVFACFGIVFYHVVMIFDTLNTKKMDFYILLAL
jgi:peptidoglycan/LPS O-acetylase OafA/YrhL